MGKRKEAKILRHQNDIDELISDEQTWLKKADEKFSSAEGTADAAKKILELKELQKFLGDMLYHMTSNLDTIAVEHIRDDRRIFGNSRYVYESDVVKKIKSLRLRNPELDEVEEAIGERKTRVADALAETVRNCTPKLKEVAESIWYSEAYDSCESLRKLFSAATAAKTALGEESPFANNPSTASKRAGNTPNN